MPNDNFGRSVTFSSDGAIDTYTINDGSGNIFSIQVPAGKAQPLVYMTINSMAPIGYIPPDEEDDSQQ